MKQTHGRLDTPKPALPLTTTRRKLATVAKHKLELYGFVVKERPMNTTSSVYDVRHGHEVNVRGIGAHVLCTMAYCLELGVLSERANHES